MSNSDTNSFDPISFPAADGYALSGRLYQPSGPARATVLALPGIGVPQRVFRHIARFLADRGVRVLSVDYRGIGASRDEAGLATASLTTWATCDATGALDEIARRGWKRPVLLAHSFGGQALGIADRLHATAGAILVGSQMGHPHHWRGLARLKVELLWRLFLPVTTRVCSVVPRWVVGEELPIGVGREWMRWGRSPDWLASHVDGADARYARYTKPVLAYAVSDDDIAPSGAVQDLLDRLRNAQLTRVDVTPAELERARIGHVGLFRPDGTEDIWRRWLRFAVRHGAPDRRLAPVSQLAS